MENGMLAAGHRRLSTIARHLTSAGPSETAVGVKKNVAPGSGGPKYTMAEVEKHTTKESCWVVVGGKVYDVTKWLTSHPGGADILLGVAGTDATDEFTSIHPDYVWTEHLGKWYVGDLVQSTAVDAAKAPADAAVGPLVALDARRRVPFVLVARSEPTRNTRRLRFALQGPQQEFGLPIGKHVMVSLNINGALVLREYTPVSNGPGYFELLIKVYFANEHPNFPKGGVMSQALDRLKPGDFIHARGPVGEIELLGRGRLLVKSVVRNVRRLGLVAGGTGITPCWQALKSILDDPSDPTQVWLVYANPTEADILLREELEALAANLPGPGADTVSLLCGPPPMRERAVIPALLQLGHSADSFFQF